MIFFTNCRPTNGSLRFIVHSILCDGFFIHSKKRTRFFSQVKDFRQRRTRSLRSEIYLYFRTVDIPQSLLYTEMISVLPTFSECVSLMKRRNNEDRIKISIL